MAGIRDIAPINLILVFIYSTLVSHKFKFFQSFLRAAGNAGIGMKKGNTRLFENELNLDSNLEWIFCAIFCKIVKNI
jgi:hypothetical protein